ncbi:glutathione S-transferase family protein [Hwanghaeella sp.]|uniref:glutathione S-transferase family protein n=1 Tax=Hwanghaeella sp. TaxID=2605943 RepID=UPI003CCB7723
MLTVWGRPNSINVQIVMWTAAELELETDRKDVGGAFGGLDTPDYRAMNPNGRIPTVQDGDLTIWESNACARYLAARYGAGSLWPEDPAERATADMWMDWKKTSLMGPMTTVFWGLVRTPEADRDDAAITAAADSARTLYAMLDEWLAGKDYLLGDRLTIGDIPAGAMCYRFMNLVQDRPSMPNLEAWYERLSSRPAYRDHVMLPIT